MIYIYNRNKNFTSIVPLIIHFKISNSSVKKKVFMKKEIPNSSSYSLNTNIGVEKYSKLILDIPFPKASKKKFLSYIRCAPD